MTPVPLLLKLLMKFQLIQFLCRICRILLEGHYNFLLFSFPVTLSAALVYTHIHLYNQTYKWTQWYTGVVERGRFQNFRASDPSQHFSKLFIYFNSVLIKKQLIGRTIIGLDLDEWPVVLRILLLKPNSVCTDLLIWYVSTPSRLYRTNQLGSRSAAYSRLFGNIENILVYLRLSSEMNYI